MDVEAKKRALRMITYGLYVLTAADGDEVAAGTVNWLSQASFDPPLVMVGIKVGSHLHALIERTGTFAVNVLAADQKAIAQDFFRTTKVEDGKLSGHPFEPGPATGAPLLVELPAWWEARVVDKVARGDHTVYVAEVVEAGVRRPDAKPLVLWDTGWYYGG